MFLSESRDLCGEFDSEGRRVFRDRDEFYTLVLDLDTSNLVAAIFRLRSIWRRVGTTAAFPSLFAIQGRFRRGSLLPPPCQVHFSTITF
jgi:hypothetical protein